MDSWMDRYNSNVRNRAFNQTQNVSNLTPTNIPSNVSDCIEGNGIDLNEWSTDTTGDISTYGTSRTVSDFVSGVRNTDLITLGNLANNTRSSLQMQNSGHTPTTLFSQATNFGGAFRTVSDFVSSVTNTGLIPLESLQNNARSSLQTPNIWHTPTTLFSQSTHFHGASRTVSDFVSGVTNTSLIPSEYLPNINVRSSLQIQNLWNSPTTSFYESTQFHGAASDIVSGVTNVGLIPSESLHNNPRNSLQTQNLWHAPTTSFAQSTHFHEASHTVSDFVSGVTNTGLISSDYLSNNARSSLQMQNLWHAPTNSFSQDTHFHGASRTMSEFLSGITNAGYIPSERLPNNARSSLQTQNLIQSPTTLFSQSTHFHGASSMDLLEDSRHLTFIEQHRDFHGGSSFASRNQSNAFIQPSGSPIRYLGENGLWDAGRDVNFLRNNVDPQPLSLIIGENVADGSVRHLGNRDDPIVIEDDEEDEDGYAQQDGIFYNGEMSYEVLLPLQENIGILGIGLKGSIISKLMKRSKYQSIKMKNCSDSCCICLETYEDGAEIGKNDCGHEFHYQCIREWLQNKNSCPICRRIALTP